MKKFYISFVVVLIITFQSLACDVCGCSLGGNYFGILPFFNKNFVGLRWSQAKFYSYIHDSKYLPAQYSNDTYNNIELWGRFYVTKRFQVFAFIPYVYNDMNGTDQVVTANGIGDITLMSNYLVFNTGEDKTRLFKHTLMAGGGFKLPTGKFSLKDRGKIINRNFQVGTGSLDFLLATVYTLRYKKAGANIEAGYKINTRNSHGYLFGNQFHLSSQLFYWQNFKSFSFLPSVGVAYEAGAKHKDGDIIQENTGGSVLLGTAGLDTYYKNFTIGVNAKLPVAQNYNSDSTADITSKSRWVVSLTYSF